VPGQITATGVHSNVFTLLAYTSAWLIGSGCIPLNYLMEDAATAEITRVQLWQWVHYGARMDSGELVSTEYVDGVIREILKEGKLGGGESVEVAVRYLKEQIRRSWPSEFLTSDLMPYLARKDGVEEKWYKAVL
jgi:malate synthase